MNLIVSSVTLSLTKACCAVCSFLSRLFSLPRHVFADLAVYQDPRKTPLAGRLLNRR